MPSRPLTVTAILLFFAGAAPAADPSTPAGRWKVRLPEGDDALTLLVDLKCDGGAWAGEFRSGSSRFDKSPAFTRVEVDGRAVRFTLARDGREFVQFDGLLAGDGSRLAGSLTVLGGPLQTTELLPSKLLRADDAADLAREDALQLSPGPALDQAAALALGQAGAKAVPPDEVRAIAARVAGAAARYGARWEAATALKLATLLADQKPYADTAAAHARRAEQLLPAAATPGERLAVLSILGQSLAHAGKADDAARVAAEVARIEAREYAEHQKAGLGVDRFAGRATKSDRVLVVEVFTGAECPPCVPIDLAADALVRAYGPGEVLVLNHHVHAPGLDPLAHPDCGDRAAFYGDNAGGAPAVFVNGAFHARGVGPGESPKSKLAALRKQLDAHLDKPAGAALTVTAARDGGKFTVTANVKLPAPGRAVLRFALVEELVRYPGGNGVKFHARVVRGMPGGAKGFAVSGTALGQSVTIDPAAVRARQAAYLAETVKAEGDFPRPDRPLDFKNLSVVAFVQDDGTGEVLQAAQVALPAGK